MLTERDRLHTIGDTFSECCVSMPMDIPPALDKGVGRANQKAGRKPAFGQILSPVFGVGERDLISGYHRNRIPAAWRGETLGQPADRHREVTLARRHGPPGLQERRKPNRVEPEAAASMSLLLPRIWLAGRRSSSTVAMRRSLMSSTACQALKCNGSACSRRSQKRSSH